MMSESGKKTTTVISCTTFETVKVSDPIVFYEADRAHIIYMAENCEGEDNFYVGLVKDIEKRVKTKRDVEFFEHNATVYKYSDMLRTVNTIIKSEREKYGRFVDIYVNISSGTSEYAAAAMCACMMDPYAIPFTVSVKEHNIPLEKYKEMIEEGAPFGDAKSVNPPRMIETFNIEPPEEEMVRYLAFIASLEDRAYANTTVMRLMEEAGLWKYNDDGKGKNSASMHFRRNVLEPLEENGWIEKPTRNRWEITPSGRAILDIFCDKDDLRSYEEIIRSLREMRDCMCRSVCDCMHIPFEDEQP